MKPETIEPGAMRVDKWLWVARFFRTRSLATAAIVGHKVRINDEAIKPARQLRIGDTLAIDTTSERYVVVVRALSDQRGRANAARLLYEETTTSLSERERKHLAPEPGALRRGRPTKRDRRLIHRFGA